MDNPGSEDQEPEHGTGIETSRHDAERLSHFLALLSDENEGVRWKAAETLGRMGDPAAVEDLIGTLWDDDERVRLKAVWALGQIQDPRAVAPLRRLYRMENENIREIITEALEAIARQRTGE